MAQAQKRRPASDWAPIEAPPPQPPSFIGRLVDAVSRRREALRRLGIAASVIIIAFAATIFLRTLIRIDPVKVKAAIAGTGGDQIALSFAFTALSYLALTGYDAPGAPSPEDQGPIPVDGARLLRQLRVFVHAGLSAGDGGGGPLLDLRARRPLRRQGREPDDRGGDHLLAGHGAGGRLRLPLGVRSGGRDRPFPSPRQSPDRRRRSSAR